MTERASLPISVLIVTWNSEEVLPACLKSISETNPEPAELVIVDNASSDDSLSIVRSFAETAPFPVHVHPSNANLGFAAGMNKAIELSGAPLVFLMNPDLRLLPDTLSLLSERMTASSDRIYAVGPKLLRATGRELVATDTIDSTGIVMTRDGRHFDRGADEIDRGQYDDAQEVFGLTGAAALLRRKSLAEATIEGQVFDEDFFAFREDADLAWRMRGFGYKALIEPAAVAYHQRHVTPARRRSLSASINSHSVKNRFLLRIHHADRSWWVHGGWRSIIRDLMVIGACLTVERSSLPALVWLTRNWRRHRRRRRIIMRRRVVAPDALGGWFS